MKDFSQIYKEDLNIVGKKAVELGELTRLGIPIPDGFVLLPSFFKKFLEKTGILEEIKKIQAISHPAIKDSMPKLFEPIKKKIIDTHIPQDLAFELHEFYRKLSGLFKEQSLNIFTSPLAGKFLQFSDVKGDSNFICKLKEIWALQIENPTSIVVQKNIKSKIKGKIITNDPLIAKKFVALAYKIQKHFYFPQELDYVIEKNKIYITAMLPFTGTVDSSFKQTVQVKRTQKILIKGISINQGIATGSVKVFNKHHNSIRVENGEIIILSEINTSLYDKVKNARAIVIDSILQKPLDKMLYRKLIKIPTIEGTQNAAKILQNGKIITVNGTAGEIYSGGFI